MARQIANVDILTDTFNTWILRTNEIIGVMGTDVLTANSTAGITGSVASPRNAVLFGSFTANNFYGNAISLGTNFTVNSTSFEIGTALKLVANGSAGGAGQVLTSDGDSVYWSTASGTGTVTQLANAAGIIFTNLPPGQNAPITSYGTIGLKAGDGIVVDSRGISVNTQFIAGSTTNASTLQSRTWENPGAIGSTNANTGTFLTVTASGGTNQGYRLRDDVVFLINSSLFRTGGYVDATTPGTGTTGAFRARGTSGGIAYIQVTDAAGTTEWGNFKAHSNGHIVWSGSLNAGSFSNLIPPGTVMLFAQTNAPTGWTKITTHDNKALRVVSGAASSGGSTGFTAAFNTQFSTDGHVLTEAQIPAHSHFDGAAGSSADFSAGLFSAVSTSSIGAFSSRSLSSDGDDGVYAFNTSTVGSSEAHSHTLSFNVAYVDVILAQKN
jgi:hypothetical protein